MKPELYLYIIWEKSLSKKDMILADLEKKFVIQKIYEIKWSKQNFINNLKRFYGFSLDSAQYKANLCGNGPFLLIIISDLHPRIEKRFLDDVHEVDVNLNVYENKMLYREWIGIDFALHGSISKKETNHDLVLLLGKNIKNLEKELISKWDGSIEIISSDLIGTDGWKDMKQFLDVLNETLNYVILRSFENIPEKFSHHDIDILTDDVKTMSNIINENSHSDGKASVKIGNKKILLDFRYQEGHHYDENWSRDILKRRIFHKKGFYVPCNEDYFYSLLFHTITQKHIRDDYKEILKKLTTVIQIDQNMHLILNDFNAAEKFSNKYMKKMGYHKQTIIHEILYKIKRTELIRLVKVSIFLLKTYGIRFLFKKIKEKIDTMKN